MPKVPRDLLKHNCINQRMQTAGGLYVWDFERRGQKQNVRVDGQLIFNTSPSMVDAAVAGLASGCEKRSTMGAPGTTSVCPGAG